MVIFRNFTWSASNTVTAPLGLELSNGNLTAKVSDASSGGLIISNNKLLHPPHPSTWLSNYVYFEIKIISQGEGGGIYVGLTRDPPYYNYYTNRSVEERLSVGVTGSYWYSNDGMICDNGWIPFGPTFGANDTIGCGIERRDLTFKDGSEYRLFYTINGKNLGTSVDVEKVDFQKKGLYPSVYVTGNNWEVEANFGMRPFIFDLTHHERNVHLSEVHKHENIKVSGRLLCAEVKSYSSLFKNSRVIQVIQADQKLKPSESKIAYFEVEIRRQQGVPEQYLSRGSVKVGLKTSKLSENLSGADKVETNRYWYTCLGKTAQYMSDEEEVKEESYGAMFGQLIDVVGCGLTKDAKVFFTVNGENQGLGFSICENDFKEGLYPAVDLQSCWKVEFNFGKERFAFDPLSSSPNELYTLPK